MTREDAEQQSEHWQDIIDEKDALIEQQAEEIAGLCESLGRIARHGPIMGSTGDYRQGQLDVLESVKRIAEERP